MRQLTREGQLRVAAGAACLAALALVVLAVNVSPHPYAPKGQHTVTVGTGRPPAPTAAESPGRPMTTSRSSNGGSGTPILLVLTGIVFGLGMVTVTIFGLLYALPGRRQRRGKRARDESADQNALARVLSLAVESGLESLATGPVSDAIIAGWVELQRSAVAAGVRQDPADSPEEFVLRVLADVRASEAPLEQLADLYREARFSDHPMTEADRERARTALQSIRADLGAGARA